MDTPNRLSLFGRHWYGLASLMCVAMTMVMMMGKGVMGAECYNDVQAVTQENHRWLVNIQNTEHRSVTSSDTGINRFFYQIRDTADLVILMDRSNDVGRHYFYLRQKKIVADILRYHANLQNNFLHLAILTFAAQTTLIVDGISGPPITKCALFEPGGYWEKVHYNTNRNETLPTRMDVAFQKVSEILSGRPRVVPTFVLVVSDGSYISFPDSIKSELTDTHGATIYAMSTGSEAAGHYTKVQRLASANQYCGTDEQWLYASRSLTPLISEPFVPYFTVPDTTAASLACGNSAVLCDVHSGYYICRSDSNDDSCQDDNCQNGGKCISNGRGSVCWCPWGYSGRFCEVDEDECDTDPPVCSNNGKCVDHPAGFTCECYYSNYCGCFCEDSCHGYYATPTTPGVEVVGSEIGRNVLWYAIAGVVMALLLILIIAVICRKRRPKPATSRPGIDNDEYFHIDLTQVVPPPSSDDPPSPHPTACIPPPPPEYSTLNGDRELSAQACAPEPPPYNEKVKRMVRSTPEKLNLPDPVWESEDMKTHM